MPSRPERLRTVREVYRRRSDGRTTGDIAYALYAGVLVTAISGVPAIGALAQVLAQPVVLHALAAPEAGQVVGLLCGVGLAVFAAIGAVRGPALRSPFLLSVLAGNDLPRSRTLMRPFRAAAIALASIITAIAVMIGTVLVMTGTATPASVAWFAFAAATFGVLSSVAWLAGQVLGAQRAWILTTVVLAATLLTWAVPSVAVLTPWGWIALLWPPEASLAWWPLALLAITTLTAAGFVPSALNALSGPVLLEQAHRWQAAGIATGTADFASALAIYRARPRLGRSWRAVTSAWLLTRFFIRDLIGILRTPGRFFAGTAFLLLGGFLTALAFAVTGIPAWIPAAIGAGVSYAALGVFTDGFRHAADTAAAPPLYGYSTAQLYALHAILPALWTITCTVIGASFTSVAGPPLNLKPLLSIGLLAIFLMTVRAYDSAKGPLPPALLTPVYTPGGDLSGLMVLAWQADALFIATITAPVTTSVAAGSPLTGMVFFVFASLAMVALTSKRLRNL